MTSKSPFFIRQDLISSDDCHDLAQQVFTPTDPVDGDQTPQPIIRTTQEDGNRIFKLVEPLIPELETYYDFKYKATEHPSFFQYPPTLQGVLAEQPHCDSAAFKRKRWHRINERVLTGVIFLKDFESTPPFDLQRHVYGGKLEFPLYSFGFQAQAGTMIIYPSCERFISLISPVLVGHLQLIKFFIHADAPWLYNPASFPGDYMTWFADIV